MRYELIGVKVPFYGKTLWEIVGNLKNFGVGRLVKIQPYDQYPELSFLKILKVQPVPPKKKEFEERSVIVVVDEIYRGRKLGIRTLEKNTHLAKFELIPKMEEEKYLKAAENLKVPELRLSKYCAWPPLYKKLWEKHSLESDKPTTIPQLEAQYKEEIGFNIIMEDKVLPTLSCDLYRDKLSVHEMYLEIVRLKKLIKANTQPSE